jgi:Pentapeptide repeats (9 copies)
VARGGDAHAGYVVAANERRTRLTRQALWALAGLAWAVLIGFALAVGPWLFTRHPEHDLTAEQVLKAKNDVRTTLVQALAGLAVAAGAFVTYRTFRQNKIEQDRSYGLRKIEQVNELYTTAVEQLGHEQAPVRLGALYSLENLAQSNPERRQTVVDVICSYLRMPYEPPSDDKRAGVDRARQEMQVRKTAQRVLAKHLGRPEDIDGEAAQGIEPSPNETFWPGMSLDLTGATLVDFDLARGSVVWATFRWAKFTGSAMFVRATFTDGAAFNEAVFAGIALFSHATFTGGATFDQATFTGDATFNGATFAGWATFDRATFSGDATFLTTFTGSARFRETTFTGTATFNWATFAGWATFDQATFSSDASFGAARVFHLDRKPVSEWPAGWTVIPDPDDPSRGTLRAVGTGTPQPEASPVEP